METVILCGGLGTRLREETEFRPKPLVEIGGRPIVWHIMKTYGRFGFQDFVLALGYKGSMIKEYFLHYNDMAGDVTVRLGGRDRGADRRVEHHGEWAEEAFRVTLAETGLETMTGGRIARLKRYITGDTFMLTYGDCVADLDIHRLMEFHRSHGKLATVTTVCPPSRFGSLALGHGAQVTRFREKPRLSDTVNAGFFVLNRGVFDYLGADDCIFEQEPLQRLAHDNQLFAYQHEGSWFPMDTYRDTALLNEMWRSGEAPWRTW